MGFLAHGFCGYICGEVIDTNCRRKKSIKVMNSLEAGVAFGNTKGAVAFAEEGDLRV